jgi:hypothetical protein
MPQSNLYARAILLTGCLLTALIDANDVVAQDEAPYIATVIVDEATVLCGPGDEDDYAVDLLDRGTNVEVHKNISGWCKIRPPKGSFSWVPARQLRFLDESRKIAEVTDPNAVAMVGSNLDKKVEKHKFQIRLDKGERVAIVGEKRFLRKKEKISETYYKIEPPAGEFRWIEARYLSKPPATADSSIASQSPSPNPAAQVREEPTFAAKASHDEPAKAPELLPATSTKAPAPITEIKSPSPRKKQGFRDVTPGVATANPLPDFGKSTADASKSPLTKQATFVAPAETEESTESRPPQPLVANATGAGFDDQLANLETQLALAVASEPRDWSLASLRVQAKQLSDAGSTPLERGRAKLVLERISIYETHQKQALELEMSRAASAASGAPTNSVANDSRPAPGAPWKPADAEAAPIEKDSGEPSALANATPGSSWIDKMKDAVGSGLKSAPSATTPTHFDAEGKLQKARSDNANVKFPPYALLDDDGNIVAFVDSPVVKLDKHLGKRIGVYGRRGLHEVSRTLYVEVVELVDLEIAQRTKPMRTTFGTIK